MDGKNECMEERKQEGREGGIKREKEREKEKKREKERNGQGKLCIGKHAKRNKEGG